MCSESDQHLTAYYLLNLLNHLKIDGLITIDATSWYSEYNCINRMSKKIEIIYCGGWGYGGAALRLKQTLAGVFKGVPIECYSAKKMTRKVEVSWIKDGKKERVWGKVKADTEGGHAEIVALLKAHESWAFWDKIIGMIMAS